MSGRPFQKGNQAAKNKGKHKKTLAWERLGDFLTVEGAEKAKKIIMESGDDDFLKYYMMLLEYFKPKLQRTEIKDESGLLARPVILLPEQLKKIDGKVVIDGEQIIDNLETKKENE